VGRRQIRRKEKLGQGKVSAERKWGRGARRRRKGGNRLPGGKASILKVVNRESQGRGRIAGGQRRLCIYVIRAEKEGLKTKSI